MSQKCRLGHRNVAQLGTSGGERVLIVLIISLAQGVDMADQVEFIVNGHSLRLTRSQVIDAMKGVAAEPIRSLAVVVGDHRYPVKQVFGEVTGLDRLDFTSATARRHLGKLGFELSRD